MMRKVRTWRELSFAHTNCSVFVIDLIENELHFGSIDFMIYVSSWSFHTQLSMNFKAKCRLSFWHYKSIKEIANGNEGGVSLCWLIFQLISHEKVIIISWLLNITWANLLSPQPKRPITCPNHHSSSWN